MPDKDRIAYAMLARRLEGYSHLHALLLVPPMQGETIPAAVEEADASVEDWQNHVGRVVNGTVIWRE